MKSEILNILFISLISILSFFIVKDDLQHKKIKNKFILAGFFMGGSLFLVGFLFGFIQLTYLRDVLINFCLALTVAYLFWLAAFWPAGDAKLFALVAFLLPLNFYWKSYVPFFPSIMLLANIFICVYGVLFLRSLVYLVGLSYKERRAVFSFPSRLRAFFTVSNLRAFIKKIKPFAFGRSVLLMAGMLVVVPYLFKLGYRSWQSSLGGIGLWLGAMLIIKKYIADKEFYVETVDNLKTGVLPLINPEETEFFSAEFLKELGPLRAEGIAETQLILIKKRLNLKKIKTLKLQRNEPFSPWILVGLLITLSLSDNLLQVISKVFSQGW
jgi:Flp pilus assembly protein protease CpaA